MQSPDKTLKEILESEWTTTDTDIKASLVKFRRGEPMNLTKRFTERAISIEVKRISAGARVRSQARTHFMEIIPIHVWMHIKPPTDESIEVLNDKRQKVLDEIRRIVHANSRSLTDIRFAPLSGDRHMDEYGASPPVLHSVVNVLCKYSYP